MIGYRITIDYFQYWVTFCTPEGDRFHFLGDQGCGFTPSPTDLRRQGELKFFLTYFIDEGNVVRVILPPAVCEFSNVFFERSNRVTTAMGD